MSSEEEKLNMEVWKQLAGRVVEVAQNYPAYQYSNYSLSEEKDDVPTVAQAFAALFPRTTDTSSLMQFALHKHIDPREQLKKILEILLPERTQALQEELFRKTPKELSSFFLETVRFTCINQKLPLAFIMFGEAKDDQKETRHIFLHQGISPSQGLTLIQTEARRRLDELNAAASS